MMSYYYGRTAYWESQFKVSWDPFKRIIYVNSYVTDLDVKADLYSDTKEWMQISDYGRKLRPPIRTTGGDPTIAGEFAGDLYFAQHRWRVAYDPTYQKISGVFFSDNYDTPWIYIKNPAQKIHPARVSSLVNTIKPDISDLGVSIPTASENATAVETQLLDDFAALQASIDALPAPPTANQNRDAVWNALLNDFSDPGSYGDFIKKLLTVGKFIGLK